MNASRSLLLAMVILVARGANPSLARAETGIASADELFAQGRAAMANHDYETARARFESSYRMDPGVGTLLNLAVCEESSGRLKEALGYLSMALARAAQDDHRRPAIEARMAELRLRLPRETLRSAKPLSPEPVTSDAEPAPVPKSRESARAHAARKLDVPDRAAAYWVGAAGLSGLVLGMVAGAEVLHFKSTMSRHCDGEGCDPAGMDAAGSGKTWSWIGTIATSVGVLGLGTAAWLSFGARTDARTGAEVTIHGRF